MQYDVIYTVRRHRELNMSFFAGWDKFREDFVSVADEAPELLSGSLERTTFRFLDAEWEMVLLEKAAHFLRFGIRLI